MQEEKKSSIDDPHTCCHCDFNSLNDDTIHHILTFVGKNCFSTFARINKPCRNVFDKLKIPKHTFISGYAPLQMIQQKQKHKSHHIADGVVFYNRRDALLWSFETKDEVLLGNIFKRAAAVGRFDMLEEIVMNSSRRMLHYLKRCNDSYSYVVAGIRSESYKLSVLKWLRARGFAWDSRLVKVAAGNGSLSILQWMKDEGYPQSWCVEACDFAALGGNLEVLIWLNENGCPIHEETCRNAARNGDLESLIWLKENKCPWNVSASTSAAEGGHIEVLKFLHENNCPFNNTVLSAAAKNGNVEVLEFLFSIKCQSEEWCCTAAAREGHLDALICLKRNGCPWNASTFAAAAGRGDVTLLQWLKDNECPWNEGACTIAQLSGKHEALEWLRENGCPEY